METAFKLKDQHTITTVEVHGAIYGEDWTEFGPKITARWERWDGAGSSGAESGDAPQRPDYELALGFIKGKEMEGASWGIGHRGTEESAQLAGPNLDVRLIRAYGELLLKLADKVQVAMEADEAYYREHDRVMRRRRRLHA